MGYKPKNAIEKAAFFLAGVKKASSATLAAQELNAVVNYWLTLSNTSTVFSTVFLTLAVTLFISTKLISVVFLLVIGAIWFGIKNWVYSKCASETLSLWK